MQSRELVIQIRLPRLSARNWVTLVAALLLIGGGIAYANVMWTPFAQGEKLSSTKMNANLKSLADAIDARPQAHLILNQGNVDLGVYLGTVPQGNGVLPLVFSPTVKGPLIVNSSLAGVLQYDGANCTGNVYSNALPSFGFTNLAFGTDRGTIHQLTGPGPLQPFIFASSWQGGQCSNTNPFNSMGYPVKDTKIPTTSFNGDKSIQMM